MRGKVLENTRSKEELLKNLLRHSGAKKKKKKWYVHMLQLHQHSRSIYLPDSIVTMVTMNLTISLCQLSHQQVHIILTHH